MRVRQNRPMPTAIILAAGRGGRLGALTSERPKCLLCVGVRSLLEQQLESLQEQGLDSIVVVGGYRAEAVEAELHGRAELLLNPRHAETNSLYSLWLAREFATDGFVLLNADVLFDPEILARVLRSPHPEAFAVERRQKFTPEEMKVELAGERILALSKELPAERAHAENVGVLKFSTEGARALFDRMEELLAAGAEKQFCPFAFNAIADERPLHAVPIDGLPWVEIDFVEDLMRAREEVLPAILGRRETAALRSEAPAADPTAALGN